MECHKGFWNFGTAPVSRSVSVDPCHSSKCMVAWHLCCRNSLDGEYCSQTKGAKMLTPSLLVLHFVNYFLYALARCRQGTCRRGQVQRRGMRHGRQRQSGREAVRGLDMFMFFGSKHVHLMKVLLFQSAAIIRRGATGPEAIAYASSARTSGARRPSPRACFRWMRPGPWCSDSTT